MHEIRASVFLPTCRRKLPWTFAVHRIETSTRKWHTRADHTWPLAGIRDRNYRWSNWLHKSLNKAMIAQDYFPQLPSGTQMVSFRARLLRARALVSLRNSLSLSAPRTKHRYLSTGFLLQPDIQRRIPLRCLHLLKTGCFARYRALLCPVYRVRFRDIPLPLGFCASFSSRHSATTAANAFASAICPPR